MPIPMQERCAHVTIKTKRYDVVSQTSYVDVIIVRVYIKIDHGSVP